jgi:hypothetical protein
MGPYIKDEGAYLNPSNWHDPNPDDQYGYMLGGIAYYFLIQAKRRNPGARSLWSHAIAARTPEVAEAEARKYLAEKDFRPTWLTLDQARALDDETWRCPGCGRRRQEVPVSHDWDTRAGTCQWGGRWTHTRWWPDGTVRDTDWIPEPAREGNHETS